MISHPCLSFLTIGFPLDSEVMRVSFYRFFFSSPRIRPVFFWGSLCKEVLPELKINHTHVPSSVFFPLNQDLLERQPLNVLRTFFPFFQPLPLNSPICWLFFLLLYPPSKLMGPRFSFLFSNLSLIRPMEAPFFQTSSSASGSVGSRTPHIQTVSTISLFSAFSSSRGCSIRGFPSDIHNITSSKKE